MIRPPVAGRRTPRGDVSPCENHDQARSSPPLGAVRSFYNRFWSDPDAALRERHIGERYRALALPRGFAFGELGDIGGKKIVELGTGCGTEALELRRRGAHVFCTDCSWAAALLARRAGLSALTCDVHALPFRAGSVDAVYGNNLLMHVDRAAVLVECQRVAAPGGRAVFIEPLNRHPLLRLYRAFHRSFRTISRYLDLRELERLAGRATVLSHREFFLLAAVPLGLGRGVPRHRRLFYRAMRLDEALFKSQKWLRRYAWVTVLTFQKIAG